MYPDTGAGYRFDCNQHNVILPQAVVAPAKRSRNKPVGVAPVAFQETAHRIGFMRTDLFRVERIAAAPFLQLQQAIVSVYRAAFTPPPYEKREGSMQQFANVLEKHVAREGFRAVIARRVDRDPFRDGKAVVGFAYGYHSSAGQWWHDKVAAALGREKAAYWLSDAFEFVELAVRPTHQGLGLGGQLHDALLEGLRNRTAVLSTLDAETAGFHLYRKRNWQVLLSGYNFPNVRRPYMIMGKEL